MEFNVPLNGVNIASHSHENNLGCGLGSEWAGTCMWIIMCRWLATGRVQNIAIRDAHDLTLPRGVPSSKKSLAALLLVSARISNRDV